MKLLAIDTATEACSVALLNGTETDSIFEVCPQQQSQQILPMIDKLLAKHGVKVSDLDAIAYGRGPGSFTGVRIATSTIQGLALGANLPVLEVSTLAAMAQQQFACDNIEDCLVLIDARMQEVYCGYYKVQDGIATQQIAELVCPPEDVLNNVLSKIDNQNLTGMAGTGFEAYPEYFAKLIEHNEIRVHYPNALYMLPLAKHEFENGATVKVENIQPVYLRDKVTWKKLPHKM